MAKTYEGIIQVGFPFEVQSNKPIDDRFVVDTFDDLLVLDYTYEGIPIYVRDEQKTYTRINPYSSSQPTDWEIGSGGGSNSGSFSGSFIGDGSGLTNIPISAINGLDTGSISIDLSKIISGSYSASISENGGLKVNTFVSASSFTGSLYGTASNAISSSYAVSSSLAQQAVSSSYSLVAVSSSFSNISISASYAFSASISKNSISASLAENAISSSYASVSVSASYAENSNTASFAQNSTSASLSQNAISSSFSVSSSISQNSISSSYSLVAESSSLAMNSVSASFSNNSTSASYSLNSSTASLAQQSVSASVSQNSISASYSVSSSYYNEQDPIFSSLSGSYATTSSILSYVLTSSFNSYTSSNDNRVNSLINKTGSYATTGSNTFSGSQNIIGSVIASYFYGDGSHLTGIPTGSGGTIDTGSLVNISSFNSYTGSNDTRVNNLTNKTGSYATMGSNTFIGNQIISGSVNISGSISASNFGNIISHNVNEFQLTGSYITEISTNTLTNKTLNDVTNYIDADALHVKCYCDLGSSATILMPVYFDVWNSTNSAVTVKKAANGGIKCDGLMETAGGDNTIQSVRTSGLIINCNTNTWSEGTVLYVGISGTLTSTKPASNSQAVAKVYKQNSTTGIVNVTIDEISDDLSGYVPTSRTINGLDLTANRNLVESLGYAMSDATSDITSGVKVPCAAVPYNFTITGVRAQLGTAAVGALLLNINIKKNGTSIFSTQLTFDSTETLSETAATPYVLTASTIPVLTSDVIELSVSQAGGVTTAAKNLTLFLIGYKTI